MIIQLKKILVLFLWFSTYQLVYSQDQPDWQGIELDLSDQQGFCAPLNMIIPVDAWPDSNPPTTEYIFHLHDIEEPYTTDVFVSHFHNDSLPDSIDFGTLENSSCNATGFGYELEIYVKDTTYALPFSSETGKKAGIYTGLTVNGQPEASFTFQKTDCETFTFTNTSISGELVEDFSCIEISNTDIVWAIFKDGIEASPSDYSILEGELNPGTGSLNIEFEPGTYDILITAGNPLICSDIQTVTICVEDINFDINDLNFNIPDEVCINEEFTIENGIDELDISCNSTNENWFVWQTDEVEMSCIYEDPIIIDGQPFFADMIASNPTFSFPNPGDYRISFTTVDPCFPNIDTTFIISVLGFPEIDTTSFAYNQLCNLSVDLSLDFDTCNSEAPFTSTWAIVSGDSGEFEGSLNVNENNLVVENTGDYTIEYTISSLNENCGIDTAYFDVTISDTLSLSIGNDTTICEGESLTIIPTIFAGIEDFDYQWEYNGETSTNPQLDLSNIESEIEVILELTDSDDPNCSASDTLLITISPNPSYTLDSTIIKCEGIPIEISFEEEIQPGDIVLWEDVIELEVLVYDIDEDSLINVSVTSPFGCILNDSIQVNVFFNEDFENLPDTIAFCSLGEHTLEDTITHPSILSAGFWSGENVVSNGIQGDNKFFTDSYGTFMVYYTKSESGCSITDSMVVEVSSNPNLSFDVNSSSVCSPDSSYIVFSPLTISNPSNTNYSINIYGDEATLIENINLISPNPLNDTLFIELPESSCNFNYDGTEFEGDAENNAYFILVDADNECTGSPVSYSKSIYSSSVPIADFNFEQPDDCHIDIQYEFVNSSTGDNNFVGICSSPNINWEVSGNEGVDWEIDSLTLEADTFKVVFLNTGSYDITLITSNSCAVDTITKNVTIEESPLADIGIEFVNNNLCSPDDAIIFLTDSTYLNPDTTSYLISIYAGEGNLIDILNYTQSSLPDQEQGILLDSISSSSCDFIYDDTSYNGAYKVQVEAFNICDSSSSVFTKFYYAEPATPQFSIDSSNQCSNQWYYISDSTDLSQNNFNSCSDTSFTYWEISGVENEDWVLDLSSQLGDSLNPGSPFLGVQFLNSDVFSVSLISSSCSNDTISDSICVKTNLDFIEQEELILFDDTTCLNTPYVIDNNISNTQACGMAFLWSVTPNDITCDTNSSGFDLLSDSNPTPNITFFNPGIYQVSCIITNSCEDTLVISKLVNVLESPELSSFEVNYEEVCDSNHISINLSIDSCVSGLYDPTWGIDNGDSLVSMNDTLIELVFSDFENNEVQYTIGNYCAAFDTVYVHNYVPFIDSFGPDIDLCVQSDYTLEFSNDSLNGSWSLNDELLPTDSLGIYFFTPDQIGSFTLIYSYNDIIGCEISESLNVNVQDTPEFDVVVSNQACAFDEVSFDISLSGSSFDLVPGVNFFWTDSQSETTILPTPDEHPISGVISANEIGEYTSYFYYNDSLENETCYTSGFMTFIANGADFSIVADSILCDGDTTSLGLDIVSVSPNGPWSLSWEPSGQTFQPLEVYPNTTTTYIASITDANNCVTTDTLVLDVLCSNESLVDFEPFIVENETQALFPNIPSYDNILYEGCTGANITFFRPECVDISEEINIQYKVRINGFNQSTDSVSNWSRFLLSPTFDSSLPLVIPSDSSSITLDILTTNNYTIDSPDTILFAINPISYSDCFDSDTAVIDVEFIIFDQPDFDLDITDSFTTYCPGDDALIEVFPNGGVGAEMIAQGSTSDIAPYVFEWDHIGSSASQIMNPEDTTTYSVTVTDVCGLIEEASVEVFVTQYDPLLATADRTHVCEDTLAQICVTAQGGEGNYTYSWSNGYLTECIDVFYNTDPYIVTVTDGCDNQVLENGYVDNGIPDPPYFEYLPIPHIEFGIEFYNYTPSVYGHTYLWSFDDSFGSNHFHPTHVYPSEGSYNVTLSVYDSLYQDCKREYSSNVNVESYFKLWVPNSFTPNNDGVNDFFQPVIIGIDYYELIITSRWGEIVFTSSDVNESWDGYIDGKIAPSGGYKCEVIYSKLDDIMKLSHYVNINLIR